jgi:3-methylcrotonyl-CoA carboxylase alpha subunit
MIAKILIANRGEIACRIIKTAKKMGIRTVAIHSEADALAMHVGMADESVCVGPPAARDSYLNIDKIIDAALQTGAQAVHPGYGFLSENAGFAQRCIDSGLIFIGPPPDAIKAMGSKSSAKALLQHADVPLTPGYHGDDQDLDTLADHAKRIGFPLLIKASAGGGGKGMRLVEGEAQFQAALKACKNESMKSFGDDHVLLEKYIEKGRHIEVQVFADQHGNYVHLFERDCSVQRRHQKVVEEAPAPRLESAQRNALGSAAVAAARAVGYTGAGTVEFIAGADGAFYFMEMNTRLQVEHGITEMITGVDLVEWQILVAMGEPLPLAQEDLAINGHAVEARIYAENPAKHFFPSTGTLDELTLPEGIEHVRVDTGVAQGDKITPFYDPMLAKIIVWGSDREEALKRMTAALAASSITGIHSNISFLHRLVQSPSFKNAELDTGLIERELNWLFPPQQPAQEAKPAETLA